MNPSATRLTLNIYNQGKVQVWHAAAGDLASSADAVDPFVEASLHAVLALLRMEAREPLALLDLFGRRAGPLGAQLCLIASFLRDSNDAPHSDEAQRCWRIAKAAYYARWLELTDRAVDEAILWPFALPDNFLDKLGYGRAVRALDNPITCARVAELLRRQGVEPGFSSPGPRRYVAFWWEPSGDELAWSDGAHSGAGQLEHWSWLEYVRQGMIHGWLVEYEIQLGSSDAPASHALVVDDQLAIAYVAPMALARGIVRAQALDGRR